MPDHPGPHVKQSFATLMWDCKQGRLIPEVCLPRPFALQPSVGVALPPERNPFQLGRSTAGGPGRLAVPVPLEVTLLITPLFWQSLCENTI